MASILKILFFFQAEDGIRDHCVTGVQTCALPICGGQIPANLGITRSEQFPNAEVGGNLTTTRLSRNGQLPLPASFVPSQNRTFGQATLNLLSFEEIGRASCRERA